MTKHQSTTSIFFAILSAFTFPCRRAQADGAYYNDVLPGGRAAQMGGAFTSIADDPAGLFYNPGGLAFGKNSASDSTTTFLNQKTLVKEVLGESAELTSRGIASFIGFLKKIDSDWTGAVAIFMPVAASRDQSYYFPGNPDLPIWNAASMVKWEQNLTYISGGVSKRLSSTTGVGFSLSLLRMTESTVSGSMSRRRADSSLGSDAFVDSSTAFRRDFTAYGVEPGLGYQCRGINYISGEFSFGMMIAAENFFDTVSHVKTLSADTFVHADNTPMTKNETPQPFTRNDTSSDDHDSGRRWQPKARLGASFTPNAYPVVLAADFAYWGYQTFAGDYEAQPLANFHMGAEWQNSGLSYRLGIYSNKSSEKVVLEDDPNTYRHIDLWGLSIGASYPHGTSSYSFGLSAQTGSGRIRALDGKGAIQKAQSEAYLLSLTVADQS